jgi:hypothetical protein
MSMRFYRLEYFALYEFFLQKSLELNQAVLQGAHPSELSELESGVADIHQRLLRQKEVLTGDPASMN